MRSFFLLNSCTRGWSTILAAVLLFGTAGCAVKLVADYDAAAFEEILDTGKAVDRFYGELLEAPADERHYARYADRYVELETELRSLWMRNRARALNEESTEIAAIILELWVKYKDRHEQTGAYSDGNAKLDRGKFTRLFVAAADAEFAKNLDAGDRIADEE